MKVTYRGETSEGFDLVWPDEIQERAAAREVMKASANLLIDIAGLRLYTAVTGAMRWQNSQEAPIAVCLQCRI